VRHFFPLVFPLLMSFPALFPVRMLTNRSMSRPATGGENTSLGRFLLIVNHIFNVVPSFSGSSGQAIVSRNSAYLVTDSRYWLQAQDQLDPNWILVQAGGVNGPKDWIEFLVVRAPSLLNAFQSIDNAVFRQRLVTRRSASMLG
jgi:hypothetical protein